MKKILCALFLLLISTSTFAQYGPYERQFIDIFDNPGERDPCYAQIYSNETLPFQDSPQQAAQRRAAYDHCRQTMFQQQFLENQQEMLDYIRWQRQNNPRYPGYYQ